MLLDFENMEETVIHNFNGGEKDTRAKMYNDENMRILYGVLEPGAYRQQRRSLLCFRPGYSLYWWKNRNFKSRSGTLLSKGTQAWNEEWGDRRPYNLRRCAKAIKTILKLNIVMVFGKIIS